MSKGESIHQRRAKRRYLPEKFCQPREGENSPGGVTLFVSKRSGRTGQEWGGGTYCKKNAFRPTHTAWGEDELQEASLVAEDESGG